MKENKTHQTVPAALLVAPAVLWVCRFKPVGILLLLFLFLFTQQGLWAQCVLPDKLFHNKEEIRYELYFKWGILMPKAGGAVATMHDASYEGKPAWHYELLFYSSGMVDRMFRVRDTIDSYFTRQQPTPLFSSKRSLEGGYYQVDEIRFLGKQAGKNAVHSLRRSKHHVKIDSVMYTDKCVTDILGALTHIRTLDWTKMEINDEVKVSVVMGRDMIPVSYRYAGQQIVERGNVKYRTRLFYVDVYDESFTQSKESAEVWIGDDENHLPIKIRAKLKIGAAEAYFADSKNLKHPLSCRIVVPKR